MKQIDNRQKQQIAMRAQKASLGGKNSVTRIEGHHKKELTAPVTGQSDEGAQAGSATEQQAETVHRSQPKVGRNDPCPCGSGKKYKKCCLQSQENA